MFGGCLPNGGLPSVRRGNARSESRLPTLRRRRRIVKIGTTSGGCRCERSLGGCPLSVEDTVNYRVHYVGIDLSRMSAGLLRVHLTGGRE